MDWNAIWKDLLAPLVRFCDGFHCRTGTDHEAPRVVEARRTTLNIKHGRLCCLEIVGQIAQRLLLWVLVRQARPQRDPAVDPSLVSTCVRGAG